MSTTKICLFDMDGTLVNNNNLIYQSWREAYNEFKIKYENFPAINNEKIEQLMGMPGPKVVEGLGIPKEHQITFLDLFRSKIEKNFVKKTNLFPKAFETLNKLKTEGIKLALVTGAKESSARMIMEGYNLTDYFDAIVGGDTAKRGKPYPDPVIFAVNSLGEKITGKKNKEEILFIGDTINDLLSAKAAGITAVLFYPKKDNKQKPHKRLTELADHTIHCLDEVYTLFSNN